MAKPAKRRAFSKADATYDYIIAHKAQILKYIIIALVTGLLQFFAKRMGFAPMGSFFLRLLLLFIALKLWAYPKSGNDGFTIARQGMISIMLATLSAALINYLILSLAALLGRPILITLIGGAIAEILYFLIFHFAVFREEK